ncbi:MAG: GCN5-related N-acetyltransferase [Acidimicrobiaceae bacterium]|nr:GCN5-related N-acetyltransferase [Acidimicrobiaceae bacterium]
MTVRTLKSADLEAVATRVGNRLAHDARRSALINAHFSGDLFTSALANATDQTWVEVDHDHIVGHLYGAVLDSSEHGRGAWIGPDGVSFDTGDVLSSMYDEASREWSRRGAAQHFAWVFDDADDIRPWLALGFEPAHRRGLMSLNHLDTSVMPTGYLLRRGHVADLELALELDRLIDEEASARATPPPARSDDVTNSWRELLDDDEVHYYVVEYDGRGVAQCVTYPLEPRRGSFDHTLHLSAVAVVGDHEHRGVARAMIAAALEHARRAGFHYAEANWSVSNRRAEHFWTRYGFQRTYVRLRRTMNSV